MLHNLLSTNFLTIFCVGYFKRVIVHPCFMNISYTEAYDKLMVMDQGDAIFRPSSQVCLVNFFIIIMIVITILDR